MKRTRPASLLAVALVLAAVASPAHRAASASSTEPTSTDGSSTERAEHTASHRLGDQLRALLRARAAGDTDALLLWPALEARTLDNLDSAPPNVPWHTRGETCLDAVLKRTGDALLARDPWFALPALELALTAHEQHLRFGRSQLANLAWRRVLDALEVLDELETTGAGHQLTAVRARLAVSDRLWRLQLVRAGERAGELADQAARRAGTVVEASDGAQGALELEAALHRSGFIALRAGELVRARRAFDALLARRPDIADARLLRATAARRDGDPAAAARDVDLLIESETTPAWLQRLAWQERVALAPGDARVSELRSALAAFPDDRGLRLLALRHGMLLPPTVIDAGSFVDDRLGDATAVRSATARLLLELPRHAELDEVLAAHARSLRRAFGALPAALDAVERAELARGTRGEIRRCRGALAD